MTKQEMLDELSSLIRKNIPRLMELREGCIIELDNVQAKIILSNYEFENGCTHLLRNKERLWYATDEDLKHSKIIGHEIIMNDVLEWLSVHNLISYCISSNGEFFYYLVEGTPETRCNVYWDFSKPYLKDQSKELIKFLYELIKE